MSEAIKINQLKFAYGDVPVLDIENFTVEAGQSLFLFGPSGSGKTTLLGLLTGILPCEEGMVQVLESDIARLSGGEKDRFRGIHMGYIFQMFNLIPYLSVMENILLPVRLHKERMDRLDAIPEQAARYLAEKLEIAELLDQRVTALSVGQQQRVAAARALIGSPEIVIADEPTSALDYDRRERFLQLLFEQCKERKSTLIFVSHDRSLAKMFDQSIDLTVLNRALTKGAA